MTTTSMSEKAKISRALNQLDNVERLIAGLPVKAYTPNRRPDLERAVSLVKQIRDILFKQQNETRLHHKTD